MFRKILNKKENIKEDKKISENRKNKKNKKSNRGDNNFDIDIKKLNELNKKGAIIIDVRSIYEYNDYHINGAISIPLFEIQKKIKNVINNKEDTICIYCETGNKSKSAVKVLKSLGYTNVYNLRDGLENY